MAFRSFNANANLSPFKMIIYPKYQVQLYYTALTSGYSPKRGDVSSALDIPHYGMKST